MRKSYYYKDIDGEHFPDAIKGDELFYSIMFTCWLTNEGDSVSSITWAVPDGLTLMEDFIQGGEAKAKIRADRVGSFKVICTINTNEGTETQSKNVPMILKVY